MLHAVVHCESENMKTCTKLLSTQFRFILYSLRC